MRENNESYIPTLDGWRAMAIAGVIIAHGTDFSISHYGALGVDLFFGISGFLITMRLLQESRDTGHISLKNFYIRRAFRILPPYLVYLVGLFLFAALGSIALQDWEWRSSLLLFRNYLPLHLGGWYTGHLWSLAVEEHFYLLWPCLLAVSGEKRASRLVLPFAILVAIWRSLEFRSQFLLKVLPGVGFYGRTDIRLDALLLGCWAALLFQRRRADLVKFARPSCWALAALFFVACVTIQPPMAMFWQALLIVALLAGTVLYPQSYAGRLLEIPFVRWIGRLSYSLYLWQQLFFVPNGISGRFPLALLQQRPWNVLAVFSAAITSYYLIERPLIRVGRRLTVRRKSGPVEWIPSAGCDMESV